MSANCEHHCGECDPKPHQEGQQATCSFSAEDVATAIINKLKNPEEVQEIMDVWGNKVDALLGRGLRRFGMYVVLAVLSIGAAKLGLLEELFKK